MSRPECQGMMAEAHHESRSHGQANSPSWRRRQTPVLVRLGLFIKAFDSLFEIAGGVLLFFPHDFSRWIQVIFQHDLIRRHADPHTLDHIQHRAANAIYEASIFAAVYLILHGLAKIIFIGGALCEKVWGYIGLIAILCVFSAVEVFNCIVSDGGVGPFVFALFDLILAFLVWREYRGLKDKTPYSAQSGAHNATAA